MIDRILLAAILFVALSHPALAQTTTERLAALERRATAAALVPASAMHAEMAVRDDEILALHELVRAGQAAYRDARAALAAAAAGDCERAAQHLDSIR